MPNLQADHREGRPSSWFASFLRIFVFHWFAWRGTDSALGQMVQAPNFDGRIPQWHHEKCFFNKVKGLTDLKMLHNKDNIK
jgi:hypothetical protein